MDECAALMEEVVRQNTSIEELSDRCEALVDLSAHTPVRDETLTVQTTYTNLLTTVQGYSMMISRISFSSVIIQL